MIYNYSPNNEGGKTMNPFFTVGVPSSKTNEQFIFEKYLRSAIRSSRITLQQFIVILTKLSLCNYNMRTGIIEGMSEDSHCHKILSIYLKNSFDEIVASKIVELLNHMDRPCYEIRINSRYEKKRVIFTVPISPLGQDIQENEGYYLHFGFTKTDVTNDDEMNRLTDQLSLDSINMIKNIETHGFSNDIMLRWQVKAYQFSRRGDSL